MKKPRVSGFLIKKYRKKKGLTQGEVGKSVGVSQVAVCRYENDEDQPGQGRLLALADLFGVEPYQLLNREGRGLYQGILEHIEELLIWADPIEHNLEIMRAGQQLLRWENFFANGNFDVPDDDGLDVEALRRSQWINVELDAFLELMNN